MQAKTLGLLAALLALGVVFGGCSCGTDSGAKDAGPTLVELDAGFDEDAGPPPCTVGCNQIPDAGTADAGPAELKLTAATPKRSPVSGGVSVTLAGKGFYLPFADRSTAARKDTRLYFGPNEASTFQIVDDDTLEVVAPPNNAGDVDIVIKNPNGTATCTRCFTYFKELILDSVSPASGPLEGGNTVTLKGDGFTASATVLVGSVASPLVTFVDERTLKAIVPAGSAPGLVDVRVFNKNGVGELRRGYSYQASLKLTSVTPPYGPLGGNNTVVLKGEQFVNVQNVKFGANFGLSVTKDAQTIEVTVPPATAAGPVDVSVTTQTGTATLENAFVYYDPGASGLQVAGVVPNHGPAGGQNTVLVVGNGLDATNVDILFQTAKVVKTATTPTANAVEVFSPGGPANTNVDVVATNGTDEGRLVGAYHFNVDVVKVSPNAGSGKGGETVTVSGSGFASGLEVTFDGLPATDVTVVDAQTITCKTPPGAGGPADVAVKDPADVDNKDTLVGGYTYTDALVVGRISPDSGAVAGGTYVTILGTGFAPGATVSVAGGPVRDLRVVDRYTIVGRTPPGNVGPADVVVALGGEKDTLPGGYTYFDPKNLSGGSSGGPLNGTLNVTVLDNTPGLNGQPVPGALVMLGSDPTTPFQGLTDKRGQITFSDPQLVKAQQVSVTKKGYAPVTVARQESQNLTVYLSVNDGESGPPSFPPSAPPAIITGKVTGFKVPRPLTATEVAYAEVWIAPPSLYYAPPLGRAATPQQRDQSGERWRVTQDGGTFTIFSGKGLKAIYARFGIFDKSTQVFTPYLMGIRRGVTADPDKPAVNQDIVLDMHLDVAVPITIDNPLSSASGPAMNQVYGYFDIGGEGVIPMGSKSDTKAQFTFPGFPRLDGDSFIFLNVASASGGLPQSYFFRRQFGPLEDGITIGPMLGLVDMVTPSNANPAFTGELKWSVGSGPVPDMHYITIDKLTMAGTVNLWTGFAPGSDRSMSLAPNVVDDMKSKTTPQDTVIVQILTIRSPRFDYNHWSYGQLSLDAWTSFGFTGALLGLW